MRERSQLELETQWTTDGLVGVFFRFGDIAKVKTRENIEEEGVIVALVTFDPEPWYVLELPSGKSVSAVQSSLVSTGKHSGRRLIIQPYDGTDLTKS